MSRRKVQGGCRFAVACTIFDMSTAAMASEGGGSAYPIGVDTVSPGILPPAPGVYWQHFTVSYHSEQTNDPTGEARPIPNYRLQLTGSAERFLYVTKLKVLGGSVVLQTVIPHADLSARAGTLDRHDYQLGDINVGAFLSWHSPTLHGWIGPVIYFPTGQYDPAKGGNLGRNATTYSLQGGFTYLPNKRIELALKGFASTISTNRATDYRSGDELAVEYLAAYHLPRNIRLGVQGYFYEQVSDDRVDGIRVPGGNRGEAISVGPMISFPLGKALIACKYQGEVMARNRPQGDRIWLQTLVRL